MYRIVHKLLQLDPQNPIPKELFSTCSIDFPESKIGSPGIQSQLHYGLTRFLETILNKCLPDLPVPATLPVLIQELQALIDKGYQYEITATPPAEDGSRKIMVNIFPKEQ